MSRSKTGRTAAPSARPAAGHDIAGRLRQALAYHQGGHLAPAESLYKAVLSEQPDHLDALQFLGVLEHQKGAYARSLALFDRAIAQQDGHAVLHFNRGNALTGLGRHDEALQSYERALALRPAYPEAWLNRGNALAALQRAEQALQSCERALALRADFAPAWVSRGNVLRDLRRLDEARLSYERALTLQPGDARAWFNRGLVLDEMHRIPEALASYERSLALRADVHEVLMARGVALQKLGRHEQALASYDRALALQRGDADAWLARGMALQDLGRQEEALSNCEQALAIAPDHALLFALRLHTQMKLCDWTGLAQGHARLAALVERGEQAFDPFITLATPLTAAQQKACAQTFARLEHPVQGVAAPTPAPPADGRIRIGYYSADFHEHATSYLMAELFERHDRTRFELFAFSYGPVQTGAMRDRLAAAFDHFIDVRERSDAEVVQLSREHGIGIAVDLKGYTTDSRPGIFARRAAPVQVAYLGYPGTSGSPAIDYLVADEVVAPLDHAAHYTEKLVHLPHSYQVNDRTRAISDAPLTRRDAGLPDEGFVFCCFNNSYKITPAEFDVWMRLLLQVPHSVLWLIDSHPAAVRNLRAQAQQRGVDAGRLVFAPRTALAEHLGRHRLADLFLDTFSCNAHTTASDALWAGLPVLTRLGETFAGRVAASLLRATGLPELVTTSTPDYEALALALARDPARLQGLRRRLAEQRSSCALFDTERFARHLEAAYEDIWKRHLAGQAPDHLRITA